MSLCSGTGRGQGVVQEARKPGSHLEAIAFINGRNHVQQCAFVQALEKAEEIVQEARKPGSQLEAITFIVGRGLDNPDGEVKVKPAVEDLINK